MKHDKAILAIVGKIKERCDTGDPSPGTMPSKVARDHKDALDAIARMADSISALVEADGDS